jgi:hypothetical protein
VIRRGFPSEWHNKKNFNFSSLSHCSFILNITAVVFNREGINRYNFFHKDEKWGKGCG